MKSGRARRRPGARRAGRADKALIAAVGGCSTPMKDLRAGRRQARVARHRGHPSGRSTMVLNVSQAPRGPLTRGRRWRCAATSRRRPFPRAAKAARLGASRSSTCSRVCMSATMSWWRRSASPATSIPCSTTENTVVSPGLARQSPRIRRCPGWRRWREGAQQSDPTSNTFGVAAAIQQGPRSLAIEVTLQPTERTLTDADIEAVLEEDHRRGRKSDGGSDGPRAEGVATYIASRSCPRAGSSSSRILRNANAKAQADSAYTHSIINQRRLQQQR